MHASVEELPLLLEAGPSSIRGNDWEGMRVAVVSVPAGTDFAPLLKGLPDDRCQASHWGYILKGRLRVTHPGGTEVFESGDLYYLPPGHTGVAEEDTDFIEIGSPSEHDEFLDAARANVAAIAAAGA